MHTLTPLDYICVDIKGEKHQLTVDEARRLHDFLSSMFQVQHDRITAEEWFAPSQAFPAPWFAKCTNPASALIPA